MTKHWNVPRFVATTAVVLVAVPLLVVRACGPDFEPDIFIQPHQASNPVDYAKGRLGVMQPGYWIAEKVVAFRYLNGGTLDAHEQAQWHGVEDPNGADSQTTENGTQQQPGSPAKQPDSGPARWLAARVAVSSAVPGLVVQEMGLHRKGGDAYMDVTVLNCPDAAFDTAAATLAERTKQWGANSANLKDWMAGQDAVFSNCPAKGAMPAAAAAGAPALLKQDRAYQSAAAMFYAGRYAESRDAFAAIGLDAASPWSRWGNYLAARSLVRQAALGDTTKISDWGDMALFDQSILQQAAETLTQVEQHAADAQVRHAAHAELNFVGVRLHPQQQTEKMAVLLAGPAHDADFGQHLTDLRFLLDHHGEGDAPLLNWMRLTGTEFGSEAGAHPDPPPPAPAARRPQMSLAAWQQHREMPWLIAALMNAQAADPDLMKAAANVPEASPAYITAQFQRARLMLPNDRAGARAVTTHALEVIHGRNETAASNALKMARMQTANSLPELLQDAPRELLAQDSLPASMVPCANGTVRPADENVPCSASAPSLQFDSDAAMDFNTRLPLSLWVMAAESNALPQHLRDEVARIAWLRALVLGEDNTAKSLVPLLPQNVRSVLSKSADPNGFAATLVLLHAPGLRPNLDQGVQRSASYATQSDFRDNWWCATPAQAVPDEAVASLLPVAEPVFLTAAQKAEAARQVAALSAHPTGVVWIGRRTIDFVKAHPEHPIAAESLALVVQATHYGCSRYSPEDKGLVADQTAVSKEAFTLLHTMYPKSDWAARTKYYY